MLLTPVNLNFNSNVIKKPAFKANAALVVEDVTNTLFTAKNVRLLKEVENLFDETWIKIKSKKSKKSQPEFIIRKANNTKLTLKALYGGIKDQILVSVEKGELTEQVLIPRNHHDTIRYEKIKKTPYGSATLKSYNSNIQQNNPMELYVNEFLEENLPKFFKHLKNQQKFEWLK